MQMHRMRLERRIHDSPADRVAECVVKPLRIRPALTVHHSELASSWSTRISFDRRDLIISLADDEDPIFRDRSWCVDDERTRERRIEARSEKSLSAEIRRQRERTLPFG